MTDKLLPLLCSGIFPAMASPLFALLASWIMRMNRVNQRLHEHLKMIAAERARVRVAVRDVCEWFESLPVNEAYVIGYLAFDDLRKSLALERTP